VGKNQWSFSRGTWVSQVDINRVTDDEGGGDNWSYDVQSCSQIVTINKPTTNFLHAEGPSCRPTNSVRALKGKDAT